jgi:hypothetical protein
MNLFLFKILSTILLLLNFSKSEIPIYKIEGEFLYELSDDSRSSGDAIYRARAIVFQFDDQPRYDIGLVLFGWPHEEAFQKTYNRNGRSEYLSNPFNDSLHVMLDKAEGKCFEINGLKYKKLELKMEVIPLGSHTVFVNSGGNSGKNTVPLFLARSINLK